MPEIIIRTFLTPSVTVGGKTVNFPFKRVDALLYYMICHKTASRREVVNILWENCDDVTGYKNLRHTLYILKKTLGAEIIVSPQKATLQLNPDLSIDCDYDAFVNRAEDGVYAGPFLQGFTVKNADAFDEWVIQTREMLQSEYLRRLYEKACDCLEKGERLQAERHAVNYIQNDPLDEQMTVFLMKLYFGEKLYHKAAKVYQNFRKEIAEELGISPLNETTTLYYQIMNQWNDTSSQADDPQKEELPRAQADVLSVMQTKLRDFNLSTGKWHSFLLFGEKGIGKTYVLNEWMAGINDPGTKVFMGVCYQTTSNVLLAPWNSIMISVAEFILENEILLPDPIKKVLGDIFPVFAQGISEDFPVTVGKLSLAHIDHLIMLFSLLARRKKLVFVLENLQAIDPASMEVIDGILRRMNPNQVMLVLTARSFTNIAIHRSVNALLDDQVISSIAMSGISPGDISHMLEKNFGEKVSQEIVEKVYRETDGNPLLFQELLKSAQNPEDLKNISLDSNTVLEQKIAGISTPSKQLLDILSLFPDFAPCELLCAITDKSAGELLASYEELKERNIIEELKMEEESVLAFTSLSMREYLYNAQSFFKRKSLHLRIAHLLEREYTDSDGKLCSRLIYHFTNGGDVISSIKYKILGLEMYSSCMQQYPSILRDHCQLPIPKKMEMENYLATLSDDLAANRSKSDNTILMNHLEGILLSIKGRWGVFSGNYNIALDAIGRILSDPVFQTDTNFTLSAYVMLVLYYSRMNDMEQMERRISAGLNLAESVNNLAEIARFMLLRGYYFLRMGELDRSSYYVTEAMERFIRLKNSRQYKMFIMSAYHYLGEIKRKQKDFAGACNEYKMGVAVIGNLSNVPGIAAMYTDYGRAAFALDDHTKAKELFADACAIYKATGELFGRVVAFAYHGYYLAREGKYDRCIDHLKRANEWAGLGGIVQDNGIYWCIMAQLRHKLDIGEINNKELDLYLQKPLTIYCKRGIKMLAEDPYSYEVEILKKCLYYGINKERPYTAQELYSKNKNFMTE